MLNLIYYSLKKINNDIRVTTSDLHNLYFNFYNDFSNFLILNRIKFYFIRLNDLRKYFLKKYCYTINHKRIALNYLYFSMWTGLSGSALATMIRLELAYPGSTFFKGDSLKYL